MKKIPSTMVLHKHFYGEEAIIPSMSEPLANNILEKWIVVIIIGTYQAVSEDSRKAYEPVSDSCPDI